MVSKAAARQNVRRAAKGLPPTNITTPAPAPVLTPFQGQSRATPATPLYSSFAPQPLPQSMATATTGGMNRTLPAGTMGQGQQIMPALKTGAKNLATMGKQLGTESLAALAILPGVGKVGKTPSMIKGALTMAEQGLIKKGAMRAGKGLPDLALAQQEALQLGRGILPEGGVQDIMGRKTERIMDLAKGAVPGSTGTAEDMAQMISTKLDKIKKLAESQQTTQKVFKVLNDKGQQIFNTEGMSIPNVAKAASGTLPHPQIQKEIINSVKVKMGLNYLGRILSTNPLRNSIIGVIALSAIGGYGISTSIAAKSISDAMTGINVGLRDAIKAEDDVSIEQYNALAEVLDDDGLWDTIKIFMPFAAIPASIQEFATGAKVAKIQQDTLRRKQEKEAQDTEVNDYITQATELERQKQENALQQQGFQRDYLEKKQTAEQARQEAYERYDTLDFERKQAADAEMRDYYTKQQAAKAASEEENRRFWEQYEANKQAYWEEYQRKKKEEAPSKLNFGIL